MWWNRSPRRSRSAVSLWPRKPLILESLEDRVVPAGPTTAITSLTPNPANTPPTVTATISETGGKIAAAEFFIDTPGANGTGTAITSSSPAFGKSSSVTVTFTLSSTAFNKLLVGSHTIFVHGEDAKNIWGPSASTTFTIQVAFDSNGNLNILGGDSVTNVLV